MTPLPRDGAEAVILLHGIGHTRWNMRPMETALRRAGYETLSLSYPSRRHDIAALSDWLAARIVQSGIWARAARVHFVCHSMGGLVAGGYLESRRADIPAKKAGRVVMLGTPHGGSEVADTLCRLKIYQWVFGPAGQELTTRARGMRRLTPWYELGIVAGTRAWLYPAGLLFIPGIHDGCVSVESTRLPGQKDHLSVPVLHGFMSWSPAIQRQTIHFLQNGQFHRDGG